VRSHGDLDLVVVEAGLFVDEALDFVNAVEDGLEPGLFTEFVSLSIPGPFRCVGNTSPVCKIL